MCLTYKQGTKMKIFTLILLFITSVFAMSTQPISSTDTQFENERLCKFYSKKMEIYKHNIREDGYAAQTLHHYKLKVDEYCK